MYREIPREKKPVVIVADHHAEFTRNLIEKPGKFDLETIRTVVRNVKSRGFLGFGKKDVQKQEAVKDTVQHDITAEAISARIRPKSYGPGQEKWGFTPLYSSLGSGISSLRIGSSNVVDSTHNINRGEDWHYPLEDPHDVEFNKAFLGISEDLARAIVDEAKNDSRPHDITVARFRIKLPREQKIDRRLLDAPASQAHEQQLLDFLIQRMPSEMQTAKAQGKVDINFYRDNDATVAIVKTKPPV